MAIFEDKVSEKDFNTFKEEIFQKIESLKKQLEKTPSDSEKNIIDIENNITDIFSRIKELEPNIKNNLQNIEAYANTSKEEVDKIKQVFENVNTTLSELNNKLNETEEYRTSILDDKEKIDTSVEDIENKIASINKSLEIANTLPTELENIQKLLDESQEVYNTIEGLKNHSLNKKSEIDKLYKEIYGEDIPNDETEETEHIDGLKDKLSNTYNTLSNNIEKLQDTLDASIAEEKKSIQNLLSTSEDKINEVKNTLETLLPGAMSAGLSSAYEKKTEDEKEAKKSLENSFGWSIFFLVVVSLLPVGVDIYLLMHGSELIQVIKDTPNLIMSIFPIYLPILWYAYSSNKKLNLSKRLIEEYTHKASLGKTFEGLSTQIEGLSDSDVRDELRSKLLFNLLNASAENPGELIKDYQKSDHPMMEALHDNPISNIFKKKSEKSVKTDSE